MKKDLTKIFLILFFFAIADGFFYNFQELWMMDCNIHVDSIAMIYSLASIATIVLIFSSSFLITKEKLKLYSCIFLILKTFIIFLSYILTFVKLKWIIAILVIIDFAIDTQVYAMMYPMISIINKSDKNYAKRDIIYFAAYYIGVIFTIITLKKGTRYFTFTYNTYNFISVIFLIISLFYLSTLNLNKYIKNKTSNTGAKNFLLLLNKIKNDKLSKLYFSAVTMRHISYNCVIGMVLIELTNNLGYAEGASSFYWMIAGILSVFMGTFVLKFLTFKNDYVNVSITIVSRMLFYILAMILDIRIVFLLAICYAKLSSISYSHILDAPYINRMQKRYHLAFCNLKEIFSYFGKAIGIFTCGIMLNISLRLNFLFATYFIILEMILRFTMITLLKKEQIK